MSHTSLDYDSEFSIEPDSVIRALFYGLGADGTVGANKNSIKIIGENTANYSKVTSSMIRNLAAMTVSHLRFGPQPIRLSYLVSKANFIACHQKCGLPADELFLHPAATFHFHGDTCERDVALAKKQTCITQTKRGLAKTRFCSTRGCRREI